MPQFSLSPDYNILSCLCLNPKQKLQTRIYFTTVVLVLVSGGFFVSVTNGRKLWSVTVKSRVNMEKEKHELKLTI